MGDGEAKAGSALSNLCGEEGFINAFNGLLGNSAAVVFKENANKVWTGASNADVDFGLSLRIF